MPPPSKLDQARLLLEAGKLEPARAAVARILQTAPKDPEVNDVMRAVCLAMGRIDQALFYAQRTVLAAPDHPGALADCGALLAAAGKPEEARPVIERALQLEPANRSAHFAYVALLFTLNRLADAERAARAALAALGDDHDITMKLAAALLNLGQADQATPLLSQALFRRPDDRSLAESICTILNYDHTADPRRVLEAHRHFGRLAEQEPGPAPFTHQPVGPRPERLRVGILSPDLRLHSVGFFAEPIIEHLDRSRFELFIYDTASRAGANQPADAHAQRMRRHPATWRPAAALAPVQLAQGIRQDGVHVLVELSGLTARNRLSALRLRPAPRQVTYLGYPNTTGLSAIDFRIIDTLTDPPGPGDALATERLVRLDPCFLCFRPPMEAPAVAPPPCLRPGSAGVTFGSFNALTKLNDGVLRLWAGVLGASAGARLRIKARELEAPDVRAHLLARATAAGLDPKRVEILPPTRDLAEHLAAYGEVDIALDTFPYGGTTTTCDALWMGVPVVSLAGASHASRVGLSLLSCVGMAGWCAGEAEGYMRLAASAADDRAALARERADLRSRVVKSPLCDGPGFARRFEAALDGMWPAG